MVREAASVGHRGLCQILDIMAEQGLAAPRTGKTNLPVNETLAVPAHKRAKGPFTYDVCKSYGIFDPISPYPQIGMI